MPSQFESFGIVAAEAMMHGVPVIVSPKTGVAELIVDGGGGIIVEPRAKLIAGAIADLHDSPERLRALSAAATEAITSQLSFATLSEQTITQYRILRGEV